MNAHSKFLALLLLSTGFLAAMDSAKNPAEKDLAKMDPAKMTHEQRMQFDPAGYWKDLQEAFSKLELVDKPVRVECIGITPEEVAESNRQRTAQRAAAQEQAPVEEKIVPLHLPRAHFSPNIQQVVLQCIAEETAKIDAAYFRLTLYPVAQALVEKQQAGMPVRVVLDHSMFPDEFVTPTKLLCDNGVMVVKTAPQRGQKPRHTSTNGYENMHHKFMVFTRNGTTKRPLVITGSWNCTAQAEKNNWENVVIVDDEESVERFNEQFTHMLDYTVPVTPADTALRANCKDRTGSAFTRQTNGIPVPPPLVAPGAAAKTVKK